MTALTNVSNKVISDTINKELDNLIVVAVEEDNNFYAGDEYPIQAIKSIGSLRYGSLNHYYVKQVEDIPANHRIVVRNKSPYAAATNGYHKEEVYELSVGDYLPKDISQHLKGDTFYYTYKDTHCHIWVEEGMDKECWNALLEVKVSSKDNALQLTSFKLAKPWVRSTKSASSDYSGEVGIGSWSDKGYF